MKKIISFILILITVSLYSQNKFVETDWDQGIPVMPSDPYITGLINELGGDSIGKWESVTNKSKAKICREIGLAFYYKGMYDGADFYLKKSKDFKEEAKREEKEKMSEDELKLVNEEKQFLESIPKTLQTLSKDELKTLMSKIEKQITILKSERDSLVLQEGVSEEYIKSKENTINTLNKEKEVVGLTIKNGDLETEKGVLKVERNKYRKGLFWSIGGLGVLGLVIVVLSQRKTIKYQDKEIVNQIQDINKKNTYLEHAAKIIRHDIHSGINTYIPRGISSLERRLTNEDIEKLKLETPLKMIKDGLLHTQKVYKSVYEFTNLVKQDVNLDTKKHNLKTLLESYFSGTSYSNQIIIEELVDANVNDILFCVAVDNLVKNGLKYNNKDNKFVKLCMDNGYLIIQDNGTGLSKSEFDKICSVNPDIKNKNKITGLGLNISLAIFKEHKFELDCERNDIGTKMKIKLN